MPGSTVEIQTADGVADAYLSTPDDGGDRRGGVLFVMDAYGLRPRIEEMADRIAAEGYAVLAPNVTPSLTTVRQPLAELGRTAISLLGRMLDRQRVEALRVELATRLVVRDSTAPPFGQ